MDWRWRRTGKPPLSVAPATTAGPAPFGWRSSALERHRVVAGSSAKQLSARRDRRHGPVAITGQTLSDNSGRGDAAVVTQRHENNAGTALLSSVALLSTTP